MKTKLIKKSSGMEVEQDGKSYPVRSEDKEGFHKLAHETVDMIAASEYFIALSQGIEIPSERVIINWKCNIDYNCSCESGKCNNKIEYATLLTDDKEGDAVEFAEWIHWNATQDSKQKGKWMTVGSIGLTTKELYERFKSTLTN